MTSPDPHVNFMNQPVLHFVGQSGSCFDCPKKACDAVVVVVGRWTSLQIG